jgi:hypothetical protein
MFKPGSVTVGTLRTQDIKGSQVGQIKTEVQKALETASERWTDMLNLFPRFARERIIPTLDAANAEISSRGVRPFLTQADTMFLERGLGSVFGGGSDPEKFVKSAEAFKERITPVLEFLKQRRHGIHHLIRSGDYGRA